MARSCYVASSRPDGIRGQFLPIEYLDVRENDVQREECAEDLIPVILSLEEPDKVTYIKASLQGPLKGKLNTFLQENSNVFA